MVDGTGSYQEIIPHLFRLEYSRMTAVLCRHFGLKNMEIAEDIVSETFLKASETWRSKGIPEKPAAWLYVVAKNKTLDYLKRGAIYETRVKGQSKLEEVQVEQGCEFTQQVISDSQLAMIFAVCNPAISQECQISLALQILCGFSIEEIADAFLAKKETIKKRLQRGRDTLRNDNFKIEELPQDVILQRLDTVLITLYLLFNEGYYSKSGNSLIRKELCLEATRLAHILTGNQLTNTADTNALLALMCYQASRLDARLGQSGETILFDLQDRNRWSKELIDKGNYYLVNACTGNGISKYHLEAGIAYWHVTPEVKNKWGHILTLYNQLILIEYSPMTALNRAFAYAKVYGNVPAIREAEKLKLIEINYYHALLGYLYTDIDKRKAVSHYKLAIEKSKSLTEKETLLKELRKLLHDKNITENV